MDLSLDVPHRRRDKSKHHSLWQPQVTWLKEKEMWLLRNGASKQKLGLLLLYQSSDPRTMDKYLHALKWGPDAPIVKLSSQPRLLTIERVFFEVCIFNIMQEGRSGGYVSFVSSEADNKVSLAENKECLAQLDAHECTNVGVDPTLYWTGVQRIFSEKFYVCKGWETFMLRMWSRWTTLWTDCREWGQLYC